MKVEFSVSLPGGDSHMEEVEIPDGSSDEEIEERYRDWLDGQIEGGWMVME